MVALKAPSINTHFGHTTNGDGHARSYVCSICIDDFQLAFCDIARSFCIQTSVHFAVSRDGHSRQDDASCRDYATCFAAPQTRRQAAKGIKEKLQQEKLP